MFSAGAKIVKPNNKRPNEFETTISQAILELESSSDLKTHLRELYITAARELDVGNGRKAIIIFVPVPQLRQFQKIQVRLVRELEKKFSGKHVIFIAQRRILPKPKKGKKRLKAGLKQKRPYSRTLTAVQDNMLEDLVFPAEIVGKRTRFRMDATAVLKVHLDKAQQNNVEHKDKSVRDESTHGYSKCVVCAMCLPKRPKARNELTFKHCSFEIKQKYMF